MFSGVGDSEKTADSQEVSILDAARKAEILRENQSICNNELYFINFCRFVQLVTPCPSKERPEAD